MQQNILSDYGKLEELHFTFNDMRNFKFFGLILQIYEQHNFFQF